MSSNSRRRQPRNSTARLTRINREAASSRIAELEVKQHARMEVLSRMLLQKQSALERLRAMGASVAGGSMRRDLEVEIESLRDRIADSTDFTKRLDKRKPRFK